MRAAPGARNCFVERLWRSVKYEEVYLHDYASPREARRPHGGREQALRGPIPQGPDQLKPTLSQPALLS